MHVSSVSVTLGCGDVYLCFWMCLVYITLMCSVLLRFKVSAKERNVTQANALREKKLKTTIKRNIRQFN